MEGRQRAGQTHRRVFVLLSFPLSAIQNICPQNPLARALITSSKDWSDIFAPDGQILREGELIRRTNLSHTLEIIAREGANGFYQAGYLARVIIDC